LQQGLQNILTIRAQLGGRLNEIDNANEVNGNVKLLLQESRSKLEDVDFAEVISNFQFQNTVLQAAQQSFVRIQGLQLFNFL